jgi:bacterial/archaeal transporter family protein
VKGNLDWRMPAWLFYCILTVLLWGSWGMVSKAAVDIISPLMNQVLYTLGLVPPLIVAARARGLLAGADKRRGTTYGIVTGLLGGVGNVAFFAALGAGGKASTVVPLTSVYPLFTVFAALIVLKEKLNRVQIAGIGLALAAIYLLSSG